LPRARNPPNFGISVPGQRWHAHLLFELVAMEPPATNATNHDAFYMRVQAVMEALLRGGARDYAIMQNKVRRQRINALSVCVSELYDREQRYINKSRSPLLAGTEQQAAAVNACVALHRHRIRAMTLLLRVTAEQQQQPKNSVTDEDLHAYVNGACGGLEDASRETLLHVAVRNGEVDVVDVLLSVGGADIGVADSRGQTALYHFAARGGSDPAMLALLTEANERRKQRSRVSLFFDCAADNGMTPLEAAVRYMSASPSPFLSRQFLVGARASGAKLDRARLLCLVVEALAGWVRSRGDRRFPQRVCEVVELLMETLGPDAASEPCVFGFGAGDSAGPAATMMTPIEYAITTGAALIPAGKDIARRAFENVIRALDPSGASAKLAALDADVEDDGVATRRHRKKAADYE
jgi:hypothetical protein